MSRARARRKVHRSSDHRQRSEICRFFRESDKRIVRRERIRQSRGIRPGVVGRPYDHLCSAGCTRDLGDDDVAGSVIRHLDAQRVAVASGFSFDQLNAVLCAVDESYRGGYALGIDDPHYDCVGATVLEELPDRIA